MKRLKQFMPFRLIKKIIEENPDIKNIGLSNWGEPLLHYDLFKILDFLDISKKNVNMVTNATLLDSYMSQKLLKTNLNRLDFSVDAMGALYKKMRGHSYLKVKANIYTFLRYKRKFKSKIENGIRALVSKENENQIKQLKKEWKKVLNITFQPALTFKYKLKFKKCNQLKNNHVAILSNGDVTPCCVDFNGALKLGNVRNKTLNELNSIQHKQNDFCNYCTEYKTKYAKKRF